MVLVLMMMMLMMVGVVMMTNLSLWLNIVLAVLEQFTAWARVRVPVRLGNLVQDH